MDRPFHDWVMQGEGKAQEKACWEVDAIVSGSYDPPRTSSKTSGPCHPRPGSSSSRKGPPHRHRGRQQHLHGRARRGQSVTRFVLQPLKAPTPGPRTTPDQTRTAPRSTSSVQAPLSTLDVSPHPAEAPLPPPPRVPTQSRGGDRVRVPASPHPPTPPLPTHPDGTGLRGNPRACRSHQSPRPHHTHPHPLPHFRPWPHPGTVVAALDLHAALGAAKVGPGRALPQGPGPPAPQEVGEEPPPPAGGGLDATGRMGSHAGQSQGEEGAPLSWRPASVLWGFHRS